MAKHFSIRESLEVGWKKTKAHSGLVFQVVLTMFVLQVLSSIVERVLQGEAIGGLASLGLSILGVFVGTGATLISLKLIRGEHTEYKQILPDWRLVWKFFVAGLYTGLLIAIPMMVAAGLIFYKLVTVFGAEGLRRIFEMSVWATNHEQLRMIWMPVWREIGVLEYSVIALAAVLSAYLALKYSMVRFSILDGAGINESLTKSAHLTKGIKWRLLGFGVVVGVLNLVGLLLLGVGLLVTIPISMLAYAFVYTKLAH